MTRKSRSNGRIPTKNRARKAAIENRADTRPHISARCREVLEQTKSLTAGLPRGWTPQKIINIITPLASIEEEAEGELCLYDELRKLEIHHKVPKELFVKFVRNMNPNGRWVKREVNTDHDNGSFHMWLEDEDGTIIDPHFPQYDKLCKMPACDPQQKVYVKWSEEQIAEKLRNLIPWIMETIRGNAERNGVPKELIIATIATSPQFRGCPVNAWCMKVLRPELKVCIGNMGFRSIEHRDKIWWEY